MIINKVKKTIEIEIPPPHSDGNCNEECVFLRYIEETEQAYSYRICILKLNDTDLFNIVPSKKCPVFERKLK